MNSLRIKDKKEQMFDIFFFKICLIYGIIGIQGDLYGLQSTIQKI